MLDYSPPERPRERDDDPDLHVGTVTTLGAGIVPLSRIRITGSIVHALVRKTGIR
jgi:hypothetical protein